MLSGYVALIGAACLLTTVAFTHEIAEKTAHSEETALVSLRKKFIDVNLKHLIRQALYQETDLPCSEKIHLAAVKLARASALAVEFYNSRGIEVIPWAGFLNYEGNCAECFGIEASEAVLYCKDGKVTISRSNVLKSQGIAAVGFTVFDRIANATWRSTAQEGFE